MMVNEQVALAKYEQLKQTLAQLPGLAVAFSGGVDSTLLLKAAHEALGARVIALTAKGSWFASRETTEAQDFCRSLGVRQVVVTARASQIEGFDQNPPDRCYRCKKHLFSSFIQTAKQNGVSAVAEGSNMDDLGDYRPGMKAIAELGILSPLRQAGLYKDEIRFLSRSLGLPTWDKPSFACLASRFVYGQTITDEKLARVEKAEQVLLELGFSQMRVRLHGELARLEVLPGDLEKLMQPSIRTKVNDALKQLGFSYVTADLQGFRTGSMNEMLPSNGQ